MDCTRRYMCLQGELASSSGMMSFSRSIGASPRIFRRAPPSNFRLWLSLRMTVSPIMNLSPGLSSTVRAMGLFLFTALRSSQSIRQESTGEDVKWGLRRHWSHPATARTGEPITITVPAEDSGKAGRASRISLFIPNESCRYVARVRNKTGGVLPPVPDSLIGAPRSGEQFQDRLLRLRRQRQRGDA